jgi:hypothetical protein
MKYMLLIQSNRQRWKDLATWSAGDVRAMVDYMEALNQDLVASGELVEANGLTGPEAARTVVAQPDGDPVVTDGPYAESKEVLAGYWVVDVPSEQRAIEIAARASAAPGPGGAPTYTPIEVHPVAEGPPA